MNSLLTKILFISLLFSAAIPSGIQANDFSKKHLGLVEGTVVATTFLWKVRKRSLNNFLLKGIKNEDRSLVKTTLFWGAEANIKSSNGRTALIHSVWKNDPKIVESLLTNGADINRKNSLGQTPLTNAVLLHGSSDSKIKRENWTAIVKLLLANKADINIKDPEGKTALELAEDNSKISNLLVSKTLKEALSEKEELANLDKDNISNLIADYTH